MVEVKHTWILQKFLRAGRMGVPTHDSWLNMTERFFSKMTKQMLRGIWVKSKEKLEQRIFLYFDEVNAEPVVYHWKYRLDEISQVEAMAATL